MVSETLDVQLPSQPLNVMSVCLFIQRYHLSEISGNLEMSGKSAKVIEKSGKVAQSGTTVCSQGNLIVSS